MKSTFIHNAFSSFFFWAENWLPAKTDGYKTYTSKLYSQIDPKLGSSLVAYASPFKQWIYDVGISGASIPTGISGNGINLGRGESGLKIDYNNGRVILNSSVGRNLNISGTYSFRDFNFYISNETEEALLSSTRFTLNSRTAGAATSGIEPYSFVTPCIFASVLDGDNNPYALGGEDITNLYFSLIVYAETTWQLNGVISTFADAAHKSIPLLSSNIDPLNERGDIKTGLYPTGYSYAAVKSAACSPGNLMYIESVKGSRLSDRTDANPDVFAGIIQFHLTMPRFTQ